MARFTLRSETSDYVVVVGEPSVIVEGKIYNAGSGATALNKGQVLVYDTSSGKYNKYAMQEVTGEVIAAGDGSTKTFQKILAHRYVRRLTVKVKTKINSSDVELTDNGDGFLSDADGNHKGTIDYANGVVWLVFGTAPDDGNNITIDYKHTNGRAVAVLNEKVPAGEANYPAQVVINGCVVGKNLSDADYATKRDLAESGIVCR